MLGGPHSRQLVSKVKDQQNIMTTLLYNKRDARTRTQNGNQTPRAMQPCTKRKKGNVFVSWVIRPNSLSLDQSRDSHSGSSGGMGLVASQRTLHTDPRHHCRNNKPDPMRAAERVEAGEARPVCYRSKGAAGYKSKEGHIVVPGSSGSIRPWCTWSWRTAVEARCKGCSFHQYFGPFEVDPSPRTEIGVQEEWEGCPSCWRLWYSSYL